MWMWTQATASLAAAYSRINPIGRTTQWCTTPGPSRSRNANIGLPRSRALGLVWAVTHLRPYLEGERFVVRCDHAALRSIFMGSNASGRITRWRLRRAEFDYELQHKAGRHHHVPDALSRLLMERRDETLLNVEVPVLVVTRSTGDPQQKGAPKIKETPQGDLPPEGAGLSSAMASDADTPLERRVKPLALVVLLNEQDQDPDCKRSRELIWGSLRCSLVMSMGCSVAEHPETKVSNE